MEQEKSELKIMPIADIVVGERARKDMGDLEALAKSIRKHGLIEPISVGTGGILIDGERRLLACRDVLKLQHIPAYVREVGHTPGAELDANVERKAFSLSEKAKLLAVIEADIKAQTGERRGNPNWKEEATEANPGTCPDIGEETRERAAKIAGLGSARTAKAAQKVVEKGCKELVEAMDDGTVKPRAADKIAELPPSTQAEVVRKVRAGQSVTEAMRDVPQEAAQPGGQAVADDRGQAVPAKLRPVFEFAQEFDKALSNCRSIAEFLNSVREHPAGAAMQHGEVRTYYENLRNRISFGRPYAVCPHTGSGPGSCGWCNGAGWLPARKWKEFAEAWPTRAERDAESH